MTPGKVSHPRPGAAWLAPVLLKFIRNQALAPVQQALPAIFYIVFRSGCCALTESLQDELLAHALLLRDFGPGLGRPTVDTLKGSKHANMKEMRFAWAGEVWRVAFAFDPDRQAVLLVGGDKGGADQRRFYQRLIAVADERFDGHLDTLKIFHKEPRHGKKT